MYNFVPGILHLSKLKNNVANNFAKGLARFEPKPIEKLSLSTIGFTSLKELPQLTFQKLYYCTLSESKPKGRYKTGKLGLKVCLDNVK